MTTEEQMSRYAQLSFPVEAELGRCEKSVREILSLSPGSILTLPQPVGSKVNLYRGRRLLLLGRHDALRQRGCRKNHGF